MKDAAKPRNYYRKSDILLLATVFLILGSLFFFFLKPSENRTGLNAEVYLDGKQILLIPLNAAEVGLHPVPSLPDVVLEVTPELAIRFAESSCPDQICVRAGELSHAGQFAACLPKRVHIRVVSVQPESAPVDFVIGRPNDRAATDTLPEIVTTVSDASENPTGHISTSERGNP